MVLEEIFFFELILVILVILIRVCVMVELERERVLLFFLMLNDVWDIIWNLYSDFIWDYFCCFFLSLLVILVRVDLFKNKIIRSKLFDMKCFIIIIFII